VDQKDEPYEPLLTAMRGMNARIMEVHGKSPLKLPTKPGERRLRPPVPVAGLDAKPEIGKHPFPGLDFAPLGASLYEATAWGDEGAGCVGAVKVNDGMATLVFPSCTGWGCGMSLSLKSKVPADAAGATRIRITVKAAKGIRYRIILTEDGAGPPDSASFAGARGADGEQYETEERKEKEPGGWRSWNSPWRRLIRSGGTATRAGTGSWTSRR